MNPRRLLLIFYALIPLAIYHLPLGALNISFDRVMLILVIAIFIYYPFTKVRGLIQVVRLLLLSTALSMIFSEDYQMSGFIKFGPSWLQSILVMYISVLVANKYGGLFVDKVFKIHFFTLLLLTLYGFWYVYVQDKITFTYPLDAFLPKLEHDDHKVGMLRNSRLFFPFSSAPRLGFVAGALMLYFFYFVKNKKYKWFLVIASLFIVLVTISRGPVLSLIAALGLAYTIVNLYKGRVHYLVILGVLVVLLGVGFTLVTISDNSMFARLFSIGEEDASFRGHLNIRVRVLEMIFSNNLMPMIFGYGMGQIDHLLNISSAHSSYFTQLFEQGVFGVIAFASMFIAMITKAWKLYKKRLGKELLGLFVIALYLAVIHLAYDALSMVILWAYNGLIWGYLNYLEKQHAH